VGNTVTLPDQSHIEQLRKRLWSGREYGQAAVMVGAGFSRNAEQLSSSTPRFPLWRELAEIMYGSLYPANNVSGGIHERADVNISPGETLRLASEYETAFGRSALDDLLLRSIPDTSYYPGQLHELLLALPWSDVFTTNYDTLLERTLPSIHDRKYDVVQTALDIPVLMKPRIIKLHGSFPAHRPFLITEEDYRTYPARFPPFVNLVQQSIMENVFCLVGFSGDDPNFLYWTGWVRDNLGQMTPPIYLCGLLNLSSSQRKLLEKRFVIPIDLSPLLANSDLRDSPSRHAIVLEWFLKTLKAGEPQSPKDWPDTYVKYNYKPIYDLPPVLPGPAPLPDPGQSHPEQGEQSLQPEHLTNLRTTWRRTRKSYPGWVVLPRDNRQSLLRYTKYWVQPLLESINNLTPPENLFLLYELNWRLEKTLTPLSDEWVEQFRGVLDEFNPYPRLIDTPQAKIRPDKDEYKDWDNWEDVRECWVELAFSLVRKARESQNQVMHLLWGGRLEKVVQLRPEWRARWFYERCLYHLFRLDQEQIRKTLDEWPPNLDLPFWEAKRASILAEIGERKESERIAEASLNEIRASLQPYIVDYSILSKEGWSMLLLHMVKSSKFPRDETDYVSQFGNRWEKLRIYRCDPWLEMEVLASVVKGSDLSAHPAKEVKKRFDPGMVTIQSHHTGETRFFELQPAFALLRMFEEGALPMKVGFSTILGDATTEAAKWVGSLAPFWSLSTMIRRGNREAIETWFDRVRIATLSDEEVSQFRLLLMPPLEQAVQHLSQHPKDVIEERNLLTQNVGLLSELISRLCFRFSTEQLNELLVLAMRIYVQRVTSPYSHVYEYVEALFRRVLYALPEIELLKRVPELLALPVPGEGRPEASTMGRAKDKDPFVLFDWSDTALDADYDRSAWSSPIARLLRVAAENNPAAREHTIIRLAKIYDIGGLKADESRAFGEVLWSKLDSRGFPAHTDFYLFAYLRLPAPQPGKAKETLRQYLLSASYPQERHYFKEWFYSTLPAFPKNSDKDEFIDWNSDDIEHLTTQIAGWWDENKQKFKATDDSLDYNKAEDSLGDMSLFLLLQLFSWVVLPRLARTSASTKETVGRIISELEQAGFCPSPAASIMLIVSPQSYDEVAAKLRTGMNSMKELDVRYSIFGLYNWVVYGRKGVIPAPPDDLLNELINKVTTRRQPGLDAAMANVAALIERLPDVLADSHIRALCVSLDYLILETQLPKEQDREAISQLPTAVPVNERPDYRGHAAELSHRLFEYLTRANREIPEVLLKWRDICQSDPLPEVRRAWQ
jgi:hypothetical protein